MILIDANKVKSSITFWLYLKDLQSCKVALLRNVNVLLLFTVCWNKLSLTKMIKIGSPNFWKWQFSLQYLYFLPIVVHTSVSFLSKYSTYIFYYFQVGYAENQHIANQGWFQPPPPHAQGKKFKNARRSPKWQFGEFSLTRKECRWKRHEIWTSYF